MRPVILPLLFLFALTPLAAYAQTASAPPAAPAPAAPAPTAPAPAAPAAVAASTNDQEARASFAAGKAAYDNGDYAAALVQFERAYELSHRSLLLYNLGLAHDRLQHEQRALESYEAYLDANPNDERAGDARARVRILREAIQAREARAHPPAQSTAPADNHDPRRRKIWIWAGVAFGVVAIGAGVTAALVAGKDDASGPQEPNSGVHIEALSW